MKKKLLSLVMALLLSLSLFPLSALAAGMPFTDVPTGQWYYNDVKQAVESGLINGKTATTYCPNDNLTYAEAVKLAACMHQKYASGSVTLQNGSPWYQSYVDYAKANKIITKDYSWNTKATRAGYMEIFASALPAKALAAKNTVNDGSIPDVPMTHPQAAAIYKLYRAGILQGSDSQHSCKPYDNIKRSEVAAILTRMMDSSKRLSFSMTDTAAQASLTALRQSMKGTSAAFAAAYLGFVNEPLDEPLSQWLSRNCPQILADYPFIGEISEDRIIGSGIGDIYCIVPLYEDTTLTVSPLLYMYEGDWDVGDALYQSKGGEPILLFCNAWEEVPDTQVDITSGKTGYVTWHPYQDYTTGEVLPATRADETSVMKDFTNYDEIYRTEFLDWMNYGYICPSVSDLNDTSWFLRYDWEEVHINHFMELRADGSVDLVWLYEGDMEYQEEYTGRWSLDFNSSILSLKLDLNKVGGGSIHDQYPILISKDGKELLVGLGANKTMLPFQEFAYLGTFLTRSYG